VKEKVGEMGLVIVALGLPLRNAWIGKTKSSCSTGDGVIKGEASIKVFMSALFVGGVSMLCKAEDVDEYELPSNGGVVLGTVTGVFIAKKASAGERQAVVSIGDDLPDPGKCSEEQ
jgi:hypothetical protein